MFEARAWELTGWVRNLADGSVELEAQGDAAQVAALLAWCERGPPCGAGDRRDGRGSRARGW
jgi:acylphosphatase